MYRVQIPWLGPLQVDDNDDNNAKPHVAIGAACNPLQGEALAVVLVPVDASLMPSSAGDPPPWQVIAPHCDGHGRFRVRAPTQFWAGGVSGLLMVLVYDCASGLAERSFPETWSPISNLPDDMRKELCARILELVDKSKRPKDLECGVIERRPPKSAHDIVFAFASCQYPANFLDRDIAEASYKRLETHDLDGLLLLGDQVYLDATAGLFDPSALYDRFHLPYERLLRTCSLREILRRVPTYMMLDDHEIEDNWEPVPGSNRSERNLVEGRRSYLEYQRMAGPFQAGPQAESRVVPLWYTFELGDLPFFMADTRTDRGPRRAETIELARIMSHTQSGALCNWLEAQDQERPGSPKFIASPAPILPRDVKVAGHLANALRSDGWDGYPGSFFELLRFIAFEEIENVIFLSGDKHVSFAVKGVIENKKSGKQTHIYSIHSSGLHAPFTFASSTGEGLLWHDSFEFDGYHCDVSPLCLAPGDGFALLQVREDSGGWSVRCTFDRAPDAAFGGQCVKIL